MNAKVVNLFLVVLICTLGTAQDTLAEEFLLSINPYGIYTENATYQTGVGHFSGIYLPDGDQSSFAFGFTVPPEYVSGDPIYVGINWHVQAETPCTAELRPNSISVARIGSTHIQGTGATSGLSALEGNNLLDATGTNVSNLKVYVITSPDGVTPIEPLDSINLGFFRRPSDVDDTCAGPVVIQGAAVAAL